MPNAGTRAAINHFTLPVYNIDSSIIHRAQLLTDHSLLINDNGANNSWSLETIIEDENIYRPLQEFLSNPSWTTAITFGSLVDDALEFTGLYSLQSGSIKQGPETWVDGSFTFSKKYPFLQWQVDGNELTTDWDTLDNVSDGDYSDLRNATTDGAVIDGITISALAALQWGDWWDSTIDWSCTISSIINNANIRLCWRKCTAASLRTGCYYLRIDSTNDLLAVHYITVADVDVVLYTYALAITSGVTYNVRIVTAGHRFDIYFGATEALYRFSVFDDRLTSGHEEVFAGTTNIVLDDILIYGYKPISALLPAGAYAWNDIPLQPAMRLNDNCTAYGRGQTIIAPQGNITFKMGQSLLNMPKTEGLWIADGHYGAIYDQSGHDRHMTTHTETTGSHRFEQGAYNFPYSVKTQQETVTYYRWLDTTNMFTFTQGYTIHLLIKPLADSSTNTGFCLQCYDGTHPPMNMYLDSSGHIVVGMEDSAGVDEVWDTAITPTLNEWQLWTIIFDGLLTHTLYINGVYQTIRVHATTIYFGAIQRVDSFGFTSATETLANNQSLLHILSYAQTSAEISEYARTIQFLRNDSAAVKVWDTNGYNGDWDYLEAYLTFDEGFSASVYDLSKYNRLVTENSWTNKQDDGTDGWQSASYHKNALYCYHYDGAADYVYSALGGENAASHGHTMGGWFNFDSFVGSPYLCLIRDSTSNKGTLWLEYSTGTSRLYVGIDGTGGDGNWYCVPGFVVGRWYFICVTWDGTLTNDPILYINGTAITLTQGQHPITAVYDCDRFYVSFSVSFFDGFADDCFYASKVFSAARIAWLYQHMPNFIDESEWQQVFSADHQFVGDMIIDNGQIRLSQTFRQIDGNSTYHTKVSPYIWAYAEGHWWIENKAYLLYYDAGITQYLHQHSSWQLTKLDKYCVEIKGRATYTTQSDWLQYKLAMNQSPMLTITEDKVSLRGNVNVYMATRYWMDQTAIGSQTAPRFVNPTLDAFGDTYVNSNVTGLATTGNGLSIGLHREIPLVWLFSDNRYTTSVIGYTTAGQNSFNHFCSTAGIDFDADELPHGWLMGIVPYQSNIVTVNGAPANWAGAGGAHAGAASWSTIDDGTTFALSNVAARTTVVTLPTAGTYRAWYLLMLGSATPTNAIISCSNADYYNGTKTVAVAVSPGTWHFHDLITGTADAVTFSVDAVDEEVVIGELVIVPISNSKNFPLDIWHQALKQSRITESCSQ